MGCNKGTEFNVEKIKRLMVLKGWTFVDMACACGCDRSQISNILRVGRCRPNTLKIIADALGVEVVDILLEEKADGEMRIALDPGASVPVRAFPNDAGLDLFARETQIVPARESAYFDTGVHIELPPNTAGLLLPKSGLCIKHDILNFGVIDVDYCGSIKVKLYNHSGYDYKVNAGDKISQLVIVPIVRPTLKVVDELEERGRGNNGIGSSGY